MITMLTLTEAAQFVRPFSPADNPRRRRMLMATLAFSIWSCTRCRAVRS